MMDIKDQVMQAIEEGTLYDFIADNYWNMTKDELKDVLLEVIWSNISNEEENKIYLLGNLAERWSD